MPITIGQTLTGTLSTTDCVSTARSGRYRDLYTFTGAAGQQIAITLSSSAFDTYLFLENGSGAVITSNDDSTGTNSRIPIASGTFSLPSSGTFLIEVTSFFSGSTGAYTVTLSAGP